MALLRKNKIEIPWGGMNHSGVLLNNKKSHNPLASRTEISGSRIPPVGAGQAEIGATMGAQKRRGKV